MDFSVAFPEDFCVFLDLLWFLTIHFGGNTSIVIASKLGRSVDVLLEVSAVPVGKAFFGHLGLLGLFILRQGNSIVNLLLFQIAFGLTLTKLFLGALWKLGLVANLLMEVSRLFLLQLLQTRREKLPIVNGNLFGCTRGFWFGVRGSATGSQRLAIVLVDRVELLLSFPLGWVDPVDSNVLLALSEILAVPLICTLGTELLEVVDSQFFVLLVQFCGSFLTLSQDRINVIL